MNELVRLCDPPGPEWRDDLRWGMYVSDHWRGLDADEVGRGCSICAEPAWLVRLEKIAPFNRARAVYVRRSFRCPDHVYGRGLEVVVLEARVLREPA